MRPPERLRRKQRKKRARTALRPGIELAMDAKRGLRLIGAQESVRATRSLEEERRRSMKLSAGNVLPG